MRLIPADPDIQTIVGRIDDSSLDLQPDFQRGEVWSKPKQRLLIDSILRSWYVPPVHVVRTEDDAQEVLDGQQRLRAIFEFVKGHFTVDGTAEPRAESIERLGGLHYSQLPEQARRRFDRFTIRMFEVVDYETEEPYELFFRLNQPTTLTSAEKRNAFFGPTRDQVRALAEDAEEAGMRMGRLGFSNARMAYEDVIARFLWTLEVGTIGEKVTATRVTERYRSPEPFADDIIGWAQEAVETVFGLPSLDHPEVRFNKATTHSWLCFVARMVRQTTSLKIDSLNNLVYSLEGARHRLRSRDQQLSDLYTDPRWHPLVGLFVDRATARVNDVSSVVIRDAVISMLYSTMTSGVTSPLISQLWARCEPALDNSRELETYILRATGEIGWEALK